MTTRTLTTEENGLRVVTRELIGRDEITENYIRKAIAEAIYARYDVAKWIDLPPIVWGRVVEVSSIITQTVSLEETGDARWPENLVLPDPSNHPACVAFFDILLDSPNRYKTLLLKAVEAVNTDIPNPNGGQSANTSPSAPVSASELTTAKKGTETLAPA